MQIDKCSSCGMAEGTGDMMYGVPEADGASILLLGGEGVWGGSDRWRCKGWRNQGKAQARGI